MQCRRGEAEGKKTAENVEFSWIRAAIVYLRSAKGSLRDGVVGEGLALRPFYDV